MLLGWGFFGVCMCVYVFGNFFHFWVFYLVRCLFLLGHFVCFVAGWFGFFNWFLVQFCSFWWLFWFLFYYLFVLGVVFICFCLFSGFVGGFFVWLVRFVGLFCHF